MMFGYADRATSELMPAPIAYSHRLLDALQVVRRVGKLTIYVLILNLRYPCDTFRVSRFPLRR